MSATSKAYKFAWVFGHLWVEEFDSLDDACKSAHECSDQGYESLAHIEFEGEEIGWNHPEMERVESEREALREAVMDATPKATHRLSVRSLRGEWADYATGTEESLETVRLELQAAFGEKRVVLRSVRR